MAKMSSDFVRNLGAFIFSFLILKHQDLSATLEFYFCNDLKYFLMISSDGKLEHETSLYGWSRCFCLAFQNCSHSDADQGTKQSPVSQLLQRRPQLDEALWPSDGGILSAYAM